MLKLIQKIFRIGDSNKSADTNSYRLLRMNKNLTFKRTK